MATKREVIREIWFKAVTNTTLTLKEQLLNMAAYKCGLSQHSTNNIKPCHQLKEDPDDATET